MISDELLQLIITPEEAGERIDRYVSQKLSELSRSYTQQLIMDGAIQINQQLVKARQLVQAGDLVTVQCPPIQPSELIPEDIPLNVVYEDADVVVVDKVAGMVVHPAPGHITGTLVHALLSHYPDVQVNGTVRPGIVHRLDRFTSGLLVIARHEGAMKHLTDQQKARTMYKAYLAVVQGRFREPTGTIDAPIGRHPVDRNRQAIMADGREAVTHYRVLEELGEFTLIEAVLQTGRTHQIRVHFAYKSHPVLGDPTYGSRKSRAAFGINRQFLHAYKLGFRLPKDDSWCEFNSLLPEDLETTLQKLRQSL
jgi:23S rRNA pseudouridine1911/1915/1917 synthase